MLVHSFCDMSGLYELIESVRQWRQEARAQDRSALATPVIIECRRDSVDVAQPVRQRLSTYRARSELIGDELLSARDCVGHEQEHFGVPPERCLQPCAASQRVQGTSNGSSGLVDPWTDLCVP